MKLTLLAGFALLCLLSVQAKPTVLALSKLKKEIGHGKHIGGEEEHKDKSKYKNEDHDKKSESSEEECKDESEPKKGDHDKNSGSSEEKGKDDYEHKKGDHDKKSGNGLKDKLPINKKLGKGDDKECDD